ncbi:putative non-heme dioxygenase domain, isopenicillin N synthase [Helianthus annuus]|nr:putative non-heme dioxygenase domain, isopenicillin N synthase [Helianthus annuus]
MAVPLINDNKGIKTFVVDDGHGVKGLSELRFKTLPELFIQPREKRLDMTKVVHHESIPVIDMSDWEDPKVMKRICDAAENWGFFQVVNHGQGRSFEGAGRGARPPELFAQ